MNLINKILMSYTFIIIIPVVIAGYYSYNILSSGVYHEYYKMSTNLSDLLSKSLDYHFLEMDNTVNLIVNNEDLVKEIKSNNKISDTNSSPKQQLSKLKSTHKIEQYLTTITSVQDSCIDAGLYTLEGNIYHTSKLHLALGSNLANEYRSMPWFVEAVNKNGRRSFIGTHKQMQISNGTNVISMSKLLKTSINDNLGVILVDYDLKVFRSTFELITLNPDDNIFIADKNGIIVYEKSESFIGNKLPNSLYKSIYTNSNRQFSTTIGKESYYVTVSTEKMSGWNFITVLSYKNLFKNFSSLRNIYILIMSISFILISLVFYLIVKSVFNPIKKLTCKMDMAAKGDLSIRFETKRNDEIGKIGKSFDYMISSIARLMDEQIRIEQKLRQTEIHALQAQINPHFMYNTLNAVKWMAIEIKGDKIKNMVEALVILLKNTIYIKERLLPIEQEFDNLENFIYIMNIRYCGRFTLVNDIGAECKKYRILKMLLQPLVENSIFHGFKDASREDCIIKISCRLKDEKIHMEVSDTGNGIKEDEITEILSAKNQNHNHFSGIGVSNVDERIRLNYGDGYGLKISSTPGVGTTVTLVLPTIENEEDSKNAENTYCGR